MKKACVLGGHRPFHMWMREAFPTAAPRATGLGEEDPEQGQIQNLPCRLQHGVEILGSFRLIV